ncbi:hypothetical protein B0T11DRAFT_105601 [Plectosphaerella cucumerina]|uniref:Uncharacterized protein n=1 Tax=Plectosphaerella cucumerina TaxID=40658 RepID=A0A8K0TEA2_9PEZI|nr:hypothetical protein B0T11DRAFT_105601 [Plectosphaerella cucumerina]
MLHTAQLGTAALQGWRCSARVGESRLRWSPGQGARVRSSWTAVGSISQGPGIVARENVSGRICLGVAGSSLETAAAEPHHVRSAMMTRSARGLCLGRRRGRDMTVARVGARRSVVQVRKQRAQNPNPPCCVDWRRGGEDRRTSAQAYSAPMERKISRPRLVGIVRSSVSLGGPQSKAYSALRGGRPKHCGQAPASPVCSPPCPAV